MGNRYEKQILTLLLRKEIVNVLHTQFSIKSLIDNLFTFCFYKYWTNVIQLTICIATRIKLSRIPHWVSL